MPRETSEGEGACLSLFADRSHLPLRGKMTPRSGVKRGQQRNAPSGAPGPKRGPHFFPCVAPSPVRFFTLSIRISFTKTTQLVDLAIHGDSRSGQHVLDLRFAQSGCVIFK